ncbi:MAG: hypothetical protein JXB32_21075 [Deltaproteobacteria bacterium]|nr:hypothetical protein [Deltaproteobacteria bacterium]
MSTPSLPRAVAWLSLLVLLAACRETPDEPRAAPAAPAATTVDPDPAPSAATSAPPLRAVLQPKVNLRPPVIVVRSGTPPGGTTATPPGATRPAAGTTAPGAVATNDPTAATTATRESPVRRVEVHATDAAEGEDGRGNVVPAVRPVAIDLHADAWGGRALDPVLAVGDLEFHRYGHPGPGVLRFVAADADALPAGRPVWLRYGERERFRIAEALEVPR